MGDLRGERRLAGARGAADQDDDRHVERLQIGEALQPTDGAVALRVAQRLLRELREPLGVDRAIAAFGEVDLDPAREL